MALSLTEQPCPGRPGARQGGPDAHALNAAKSFPGLAMVGCDTPDGAHHAVDVVLYPCTRCGLPVLVVSNVDDEENAVHLVVQGAKTD